MQYKQSSKNKNKNDKVETNFFKSTLPPAYAYPRREVPLLSGTNPAPSFQTQPPPPPPPQPPPTRQFVCSDLQQIVDENVDAFGEEAAAAATEWVCYHPHYITPRQSKSFLPPHPFSTTPSYEEWENNLTVQSRVHTSKTTYSENPANSSETYNVPYPHPHPAR